MYKNLESTKTSKAKRTHIYVIEVAMHDVSSFCFFTLAGILNPRDVFLELVEHDIQND